MTPDDGGPRRVKATGTSFAIIEYLSDADGACITEIAVRLSLAKSRGYEHLNTLWDHGYLVRDGNESNSSLEFLDLDGLIRDRSHVAQLSKPIVEELADTTSEQAQFVDGHNGYGYHICAVAGDRARQIDTRLGKPIYLHANASGKAMLAHVPEQRLEEIIDRRGLPEVLLERVDELEPQIQFE